MRLRAAPLSLYLYKREIIVSSVCFRERVSKSFHTEETDLEEADVHPIVSNILVTLVHSIRNNFKQQLERASDKF